MAFVVSGQAGDPVLARCDHLAQRIHQLHSSLNVRFDPKHPDEWHAYVDRIARSFDVRIPANFPGPVIWTPDGKVLNRAEFTTLCKDSFGVKLPDQDEKVWKAIAQENLRKVEEDQRLAREGPALPDRLATVYENAKQKGELQKLRDWGVTATTEHGVAFEVWTSTEWRGVLKANREVFAKERQPLMVRSDEVVQRDLQETHCLVLSPTQLVDKHSVLVPMRHLEVSDDLFLEPGEDQMEPTQFLELKAADTDPGDGEMAVLGDVLATMDAVATMQYIPRKDLEFRTPAETHCQVMPRPLLKDRLLPMAPWFERARDNPALKEVPFWPFKHTLQRLTGDDLGAALKAALKAAKAELGVKAGTGYDLVCTRDWLVLAPLREPREDEMWQWTALPPPPAVSLMGLYFLPAIEKVYPESAAPWGREGPKITSERILSTVYEDPMAVLAHWKVPR